MNSRKARQKGEGFLSIEACGGLATDSAEYERALKVRLQQCSEMEPLLHRADALLTPGIPGPAPHGLSSTGSPVMQGPWTIMGVPSISLPSGLSQSGLPLAVQLAGASQSRSPSPGDSEMVRVRPEGRPPSTVGLSHHSSDVKSE